MEKHSQIINHFTDNDTYKFSMCAAVLNCFPRAKVRYRFVDRNNTIYPDGFSDLLMEQIRMMENVHITEGEINYMKKRMYYMPEWFYTFLKGYQFDSNEVSATQDKEGHLIVNIEGYWYRTIFWEIPILSIVSELFHTINGDMDKFDCATTSEIAKKSAEMLLLNGVKFANFGTRRRFSFQNEDIVTNELLKCSRSFNGETDGKFTGTSNVYFAMKYNLPLIGTMAHEFVSGIAGMYGPQEANYIAMDMWQKTFQGALGIFLYDTYTWQPFSDNFSEHFARCFSGLRVDSGDNEEQLEKIISKYKSLKIDPKTKQIVFSNAFTPNTAVELNSKIKDKCLASFGIGTSLTCNLPDVKPMNIVIKLVESKITENRKWSKTCKMSEDKGKTTGDNDVVERFKQILQI